ncbi:hypothetical protein [Luteimonas cellulosilyticus]|uniref:hypothetical protein n=1 Tax=Luteimonas cellulosilyticus TaxID=2683586 RepID=UPI0019162A37|nr:hypothetical protein [Luteimonas cellulosilyticus]
MPETPPFPPQVAREVYKDFQASLDRAESEWKQGRVEAGWYFLDRARCYQAHLRGVRQGLHEAATKTLKEHSVENGKKGAAAKIAQEQRKRAATAKAALKRHAASPFENLVELNNFLHDMGRSKGLVMTAGVKELVAGQPALSPIFEHLREVGGMPHRPEPATRRRKSS